MGKTILDLTRWQHLAELEEKGYEGVVTQVSLRTAAIDLCCMKSASNNRTSYLCESIKSTAGSLSKIGNQNKIIVSMIFIVIQV